MKTLIDLYKQPSYDQADIPKIRKIVLDVLEPKGYCSIVDKAGNLFLYHKDCASKTLLCAHMDMVKTGEPVETVVHACGTLFGLDKDNRFTSVGADDKNGVWLCIQAALYSERHPSILLVAHEEGSPHTVDDWLVDYNELLAAFDNCLVLDRANDKEIIIGGSTNEYSNALALQWKTINPDWRFARGIMCDADRLVKHIPSINLSIGYYGGHTVQEFTCIGELLEAKQALFKWLQASDRERNTINWKFVHELDEFKNKGANNAFTYNK